MMKNTVRLKSTLLGEGIPKICVSLMGQTIEALLNEIQLIKSLPVDILEWRGDYFLDILDFDIVLEALETIRNATSNYPLIFTFRSEKEGGQLSITKENYITLNQNIMNSGLIDAIDLELFTDEIAIKELVKVAKEKALIVILSSHDFDKTPSSQTLINTIHYAVSMGADIPKLAVMPNSDEDVLRLLEVTTLMSNELDQPIITMAMSEKGAVSRIFGEIFGSSMTFAAVNTPSAPGQLNVIILKEILNLIHIQLDK